MKCICGYEYLEKWHTEDNKGVGDKNFITVKFGLYPQIRVDCEDYKTEVYACPKCGILKIDL